MRSLGVYDSVKLKLVFGENVAQALQFVQSGNAEIGIVALSLAISPTVRDRAARSSRSMASSCRGNESWIGLHSA